MLGPLRCIGFYRHISICRSNGPEQGNALFLILIAVALFAALSYAITQSGRGGGNIDKEKAKLDAAVAQNCTAHIDQAKMRLNITGGCTDDQISYEYNGNRVNPDAPEDKHCHVFDPAGAGETACGIYLTAEEPTDDCLTAVAGETCSGGSIIYVSDSLGSRLYTTIADQGVITPFSNAVASCSGLGAGWHLPTLNEMHEIYQNKHTGVLNGTFNETGAGPTAWYWTAEPIIQGTHYYAVRFSDGTEGQCPLDCNISVRCVK